ncbi:hypothetical protein DOE63_04865 [Salmonella enterica subsp. diarizonae serovar 59:z10:-]|nr:hypothetical protein DOE63_04865 [Salmonella enterica subsp. diarizonae serovar 59:z10:-]
MVVPVLKANSMIMVRVVCLLRHICVALAPILNLIAQGVPIALLIVLLEVVTVMRGLVMTAVPGFPLPSLDVPDLTLAPLWNIWPAARDFKLTLPAAQCPVFNIEVFGTNHKIDTFCTIFTPDIIAIIRAISILTASIISFVIVLRS